MRPSAVTARRFGEHQRRAADGAAAEMHEMPVVREPVDARGTGTSARRRCGWRASANAGGSGSKRCGIQLDYVDRWNPLTELFRQRAERFSYQGVVRYEIAVDSIATSVPPLLDRRLPPLSFQSSLNGRERDSVRRASVVALLIAIGPGAGATSSLAAQEQNAAPPAPPTLQRPVTGPFLGGVPFGDVTQNVETVTVVQALTRSLEHNLGVLSAQNNLGRAQGTRWRALERPAAERQRARVRDAAADQPAGVRLPAARGRRSATSRRSSARSTCSTRESSCRRRSSTSAR